MNAYAFLRGASNDEHRFLKTDEGIDYSYSDLDAETARVASLLTSLGLKPGDRVAAQVHKSPQALFLYLGAVRAGLIYLPLNPAYTVAEIAFFIQDAEPGAVICDPEFTGAFNQIVGDEVHLFELDARGSGSLADAVADASPEFAWIPSAPRDPAVIVYTSGTTGKPKGAVITHENLTSNATALVNAWRINSSDVLVHALPIFHIHGLFVAVHTIMLAGGSMVFMPRFEPDPVIEALTEATLLMGVPTFYSRMLSADSLSTEAVANVRLFISGSAPLHRDVFDEWAIRTGHRILERYGMSETGMITSNPLDKERRAGTVGFALEGVSVRVADEDDMPIGADEPGEIQVKGPNVCDGYWHRPDKTTESFTSDGWFKTGDIGQWSPDGYLSIVGRSSDMIISGGLNVYPKEVEIAIDSIDQVLESAVIGRPDPDLGEVVEAVVVLKPDADLDEQRLMSEVRAQLARYKVPKRVHFVSELPRNVMGKVQKAVLRENYGS
ncbi:MAG: malonyl-CoA/methylmalonyl-CoA synthetase [Actinomycetota bacterium]|nr:malonyl-CoA/methylmalonyl-CoA synthetase [Actinomycetota bacterium]